MRFGSLGLAVAISIGGSACSKSAPPPGKAVTLAALCNEADGSRVRLDGYLRYERSMLSFCSNYGGHKTCDLMLHESAAPPPDFDLAHPQTGPEPTAAKLSIPIGSRAGEMDELPDKFSASDVHVHLSAGAVAGEGTRVVVDGTLSVSPRDPKTPNAPRACFVNVEWAASAS